jgi:hypothetical protein
MIKVEKIDNKLVLTIECNHEIVDDCFLFGSLNTPSEGKRLIMEVVGKAYENYVRGLDHEDGRNKEYFDEEFSKIKLTDNDLS